MGANASVFLAIMPGLHSGLWYSSRLLARCDRDKVRTNGDIHTLVRELSITRQDIQDVLGFFDLGLIEQIESMEDEANVSITLILILSHAVLMRM